MPVISSEQEGQSGLRFHGASIWQGGKTYINKRYNVSTGALQIGRGKQEAIGYL